MTALAGGLLALLVLSRLRPRPGPGLRSPADRPPMRWPRLRLRRHRSRPPDPALLAAWCDAVASEVRTGAALSGALRSVPAPRGSALATVGAQLERGRPLADVSPCCTPNDDERAALAMLAALAEYGGPAGQPLDRLAATLRRRAADASERSVHSSQARLSARVMTLLPTAVLVVLLTTSASVRHVTLTPVGLAAIVSGGGLNLVGWLWMRRLIGGRR